MTSLSGDMPDLYSVLRTIGQGPEMLESLIAAADPTIAKRLLSVDQSLLRAVMRLGLGQPPIAETGKILQFLRGARPFPLFQPALSESRIMALPTGGQIADMPAFSDRQFDGWFAAQPCDYGLGLYAEKRRVYASAHFADAASPERRTIHLGVDVFAPAGTPVFAPLAGRVESVCYNSDPLDYGHTLILEHQTPEGVPFYTLYGHLGASLPGLLTKGDPVHPGQMIAHLGDWDANGGWAPHLHFQIITSLLDQRGTGNFFGVGHESLWEVWQAISPDPNLLMRVPQLEGMPEAGQFVIPSLESQP
jgi:murein DD-endopeptidase MepM/ murein hydrolase activator NlpD